MAYLSIHNGVLQSIYCRRVIIAEGHKINGKTFVTLSEALYYIVSTSHLLRVTEYIRTKTKLHEMIIFPNELIGSNQ